MESLKKRILGLYNSGAFHITIGSFATKFLSLFGSIFVVRLMSKNDYGVLQYIENIYNYIFLFAGLGLSFSILRHVVLAETGRKGTYLTYAVSHSLMRDIVISILLIIVNNFIEYPENFQDAKIFIPVFAVMLPFQNLLANGQYSLRALFKNKEYAFAAFFTSTILVIGRIVGAKFGGVRGVVWIRFLINVVCGVILIFIVYRLYPKSDGKKLTRDEKKEVNIYSLQYMVTSGLWVVFMLNDSFLLGLLSNDPAMVADYKVAYVLPGNLSLLSNAIGVFIAPYFTKNEKDVSWVRRNYKRTMFINAAVVFLAGLVFFIFAEPLISFIYGDEYLNIVFLMRVLLVGAFINSGLRYVTANILSAMGKVKSNMIISIVGIVLQILIDILLIPKYGAMGIAYSNCIVFSVMAIALFISFNQNYKKVAKPVENIDKQIEED